MASPTKLRVFGSTSIDDSKPVCSPNTRQWSALGQWLTRVVMNSKGSVGKVSQDEEDREDQGLSEHSACRECRRLAKEGDG